MKDYTAEDLQNAFDKGRNVGRKEALAQPEQEPVAWLDPNQTIDSYALSWYQNEIHSVPLYTTPPQRTWVVLTDEEVNELVEQTECEDYYGLVEATEAKLKEKNTK